ncbi:MAG: 2-amino-4-hydroxy-6-hydroxymethyldihydropteridine diphosphokinase [Owenweeksia sp.]
MAILRKNSQASAGNLRTYVILLGGNLGNVPETFIQVIKQLGDMGVVKNCSSLYLTEAWGMNGAPDFYNQVIRLETDTEPLGMMRDLLFIEEEQGRVRDHSGSYTSRTIDLDILFIDELIIETKELEVPHPRLQERSFVLEPLCELMPDFIHPVLKKSMVKLRDECKDELSVKRL